MVRKFNSVILPLFACLSLAGSILLFAPEPAYAKEGERELNSWQITYSGGWFSKGGARSILGAAVNSVTMRRNNEVFDIYLHYTICPQCAAVDRRRFYFSIDKEKAQKIAALVDERQIKAALERPCTLPPANTFLTTVTVRLDPPPAGYAPFAYDILIGCQSPELDEVRESLDAAMQLFSKWMKEHEDQSQQ